MIYRIMSLLAGLTSMSSMPALRDNRALTGRYRTSEKQLLDRHGEIIHELRVDATRRRLGWTEIADISPVTLEAVVRAEDRRFFAHRGVDWRAGAGALWNALCGGRRRGASGPQDGADHRDSTGRDPTGAWQIASTLDAGLQRLALMALRHQLRQLRGRNVRHGAGAGRGQRERRRSGLRRKSR
ncbi:MAG: transglycosylase domain-containing protein [Pseudomonadota bacterium]|nr:transglycosylase domain-containing protein [Pseudomonadota bacterium]